MTMIQHGRQRSVFERFTGLADASGALTDAEMPLWRSISMKSPPRIGVVYRPSEKGS